MVRQWCWGQNDQDLGSGLWIATIDVDRSHLYSTRPSSFTKASVSILMRGRQNGKMLGPRNKQSHTALPRAPKRCLHPSPPPHSRYPSNRRPRWCCKSMGHANQKQHPRLKWPQTDSLRPHMPSRRRTPSHHLLPRRHRPPLGSHRRQNNGRPNPPQKRRPSTRPAPHRMDLRQRQHLQHQTMEMPRRRLHAEFRRPERHHQHSIRERR